jgi:FAD/FMN-containing dehydrogenase
MGGQSLPRDGVAITIDSPWFEFDTANSVYRVSAGAKWAEVITRLDPLGYSPKVMQSNNDFGVASTLSVNAHGWPVPYGPFGSTVLAFRLMLADGSVVECSRAKNGELFSLVMGGYGLFGIIIDLDIEMTRNVLLQPKAELLRGDEFAGRFLASIEKDPTTAMAFGRLSVARASFFSDAILTTYHEVLPQPPSLPAATSSGALTSISNKLYREQTGSELAKHLAGLPKRNLFPNLAPAGRHATA